MPISGEVAIIGTAVTDFGVLHDSGYLDLVAEAGLGAVSDAGLTMGRYRGGMACHGRATDCRSSG